MTAEPKIYAPFLVALEDQHPGGVEEPADVRVQRRRALADPYTVPCPDGVIRERRNGAPAVRERSQSSWSRHGGGAMERA